MLASTYDPIHFTFSSVLEVDPDIVRVAAANALAGSDDPGSAGFHAGWIIGSARRKRR